MPSSTKQALTAAFLALLEERPFHKITVKDVVEACGVNRNTFYYHFEDLPALLEEIISNRMEELIEDHPTIDSLEDCFDAAIDFVLKNRRAVLHIYNSLSRDVFERYLMDACHYVAKTYAEAGFAGSRISREDKELLIRYYKCECFGNIIDWLNSGMKDDLSAYFHRIYQLKRGWEERVLRQGGQQN